MTARVAAMSALAVCSIGVSAWWAYAPLETSANLSTAKALGVGQTARDPAAPLELGAFRAPLWVAPPAPPAPAESVATVPQPPRAPLKWQLLAIIRSDEGERALLYDPDADRLLSVRPGDAIGDRSIERVTSDRVDVRDGSVVRTLALKAEKAGSPP